MNNSKDMKTVVQTYLIEETQELIYDNEKLDKWNEYIDELDLKGQTKIVKKEKSPVPFCYLNEKMKNVFTVLCAVKTDSENYDRTPIPVEVLGLMALSKKEGYFEKVEIWYDDKVPDPLCVGIIQSWVIHKKGSYSEIENSPTFRSKKECQEYIDKKDLEGEAYHSSWSDKFYLLARWADMKRSFEQLTKMAKERFLSVRKAEIKQSIKEFERNLEDLENEAITKFG